MESKGEAVSHLGDVRLILTDIDGTILPRGQQTVSPRVKMAFRAAIAAGIKIGPASGRGMGYVRSAFADDAICLATALATNGMQVYLDGKLVLERHLSREGLAQLERAMRTKPHVGMLVFEGDTPHLVCGDRALLRESFPRYADTAIDDGAIPASPVIKCNLFCEPTLEATRSLVAQVRSQAQPLDFNIPLAGFINVVPAGWSKACGVDALCELLDISLDQIVVFGDGGNDVEMLAHVPNSVAVADAAPEAAAAARWHIGPCEDESVVTAIEHISAGVWPFE